MTIENDIREEVKKAERNFPEYNSYHEGYAIIIEEVDELWELVKNKDSTSGDHYTEAKHIACTAIRYMKLCNRKKS